MPPVSGGICRSRPSALVANAMDGMGCQVALSVLAGFCRITYRTSGPYFRAGFGHPWAVQQTFSAVCAGRRRDTVSAYLRPRYRCTGRLEKRRNSADSDITFASFSGTRDVRAMADLRFGLRHRNISTSADLCAFWACRSDGARFPHRRTFFSDSDPESSRQLKSVFQHSQSALQLE